MRILGYLAFAIALLIAMELPHYIGDSVQTTIFQFVIAILGATASHYAHKKADLNPRDKILAGVNPSQYTQIEDNGPCI